MTHLLNINFPGVYMRWCYLFARNNLLEAIYEGLDGV